MSLAGTWASVLALTVVGASALGASPAEAAALTHTVTLTGGPSTTWITGCRAQVFWPRDCPSGWDAIPPEPSTALLVALGAAGLTARRRRPAA